MAAHHKLTKLIDFTPTVWALALALPVLLAWGGFALANSNLAMILLKRQMLLNVEIPRSVHLENTTPEVWPSGSEVEIRYRVTGEWTETMTGHAFVSPDGQPADDYPLAFEKNKLRWLGDVPLQVAAVVHAVQFPGAARRWPHASREPRRLRTAAAGERHRRLAAVARVPGRSPRGSQREESHDPLRARPAARRSHQRFRSPTSASKPSSTNP